MNVSLRAGYADKLALEPDAGSSHFQAEIPAHNGRWAGCSYAAVVQVVYEIWTYNTWPLVDVDDWHIDGTVPYGYVVDEDGKFRQSVSHPRNFEPRVKWVDDPGTRTPLDDPKHRNVCTFKQEFESCLVCFSGERCGEILGCINWGHSWSRHLKNPTEWHVQRTLQGHSPSEEFNIVTVDLVPETDRFRNLTRAAIQKHCDFIQDPPWFALVFGAFVLGAAVTNR